MLLMSWQLALVTLSLMPDPARRPRSGSAARRVARTCASATASAARSPRCRRVSPACASSRRSTRPTARCGTSPRTSREQYLTSVGAERIAAIYVAIVELVQGVAFALDHRAGRVLRVRRRRDRRRRHRVRALPQQPVRADPAAHAGVQLVPAGGRGAEEALRPARRALDLVEPDAAGGAARRPAISWSTTSSFRYAPELEPVLRDVSLTLEHGQAARARRPDRRGQVDARQVDGALLRPDRAARSASAASTCATSTRQRCGSGSSSSPRRASSSPGRSATTC